MKKLSISMAVGFATFLLTAQPASALIIPNLFNTGVDDSGNVLTVGSLDTHYTLSGPSATQATVITRNGSWAVEPAGSAWIGQPGGNGNIPVPGLYSYTLMFDLSGLDHTTASISGNWAADNNVSLFLNGVDTGNYAPGFFNTNSVFNVNSGFLAGINAFEFRVINGATAPNPSGLIVANLTGTADAFSTVPEPATMILFGIGLTGVFLIRKRKELS